MEANIATEIGNRLMSALILGVLAIPISLIAYRYHFFKLPSPSPNLPIPIRFPLMGFAVYLLISFFAAPFALFFMLHFFPDLKDFFLHLPLLTFTIGQIFTTCTTVVFLILLAFLQPERVVRTVAFGPKPKSLGSFGRDLMVGMVSLVIVFPVVGALYSLIDLATYFLFGVFGKEQSAVLLLQQLIDSPYLLVIILIAVVLAAPVIEEFFFRGILQNYFKRKLGFKWALILTSFLFALLHLSPQQGLGNLPLVSALFIFSLYLGFIYEKKQSLLAPIALHMTFNSINVIRILLRAGS